MEQTSLPERMLAAGEEPTGDRVNTYHKQKRIKSILDALEPEEFCLVDTAIKKLQKKKIEDIEMRLKYACLAFTSCVLLPTSHFPQIIPEHERNIHGEW
ncbi:hypothetical protein HID58_054199 [Brassica napus]|uniref:Uncharacterized protein n=1 Tax=Brassica napus TaxID=3708 RepID=A0ABQ8AGW0_BRANA|nr:hypothetical protein HID58_054199 [Brassica napus]